MALKTFLKRLRDVESEYNDKLAGIRKEMATEFGKEIGPLVPEGYTLRWRQSNDQYDDENYHWGMESFRLVRGRTDEAFGHSGGSTPDEFFVGDDDLPKGVTMEQLNDLYEALEQVEEKTYRSTFGDCAEVSIKSDGSVKVSAFQSDRDDY